MSRRDSQANAERIVAAIRSLWSEEAAPSMERVAAAAGVGVATVYRHFPNRAALEAAAFERIFAEELAPLAERVGAEQVDLLDTAELFLEVLSRFAPLLGSVGVSQVTGEALEGLAEPFVELLHRGQLRGLLRADLEPVDIYWVLRMIVLGLNSPLASGPVRRRYLALMLTALMPGGDRLPPLTESDYDALAVPPERRRPPIDD